MYINFKQNRANRSVITCTQMYSQINRRLHKFATTNRNFKKSTPSDMHHRKTYMYNYFKQIRVSVRISQNRAHKFICKNF